MDRPLCIGVCENLQREALALVEMARWSDVQVHVFATSCVRPGDAAPRPPPGPLQGGEDCAIIYLLGGACARDPAPACAHPDRLRMYGGDTCFDLLTNAALVERYRQQKAYLLTPGWLARWQEHMRSWSLDRAHARECFAQTTRLVLLDTGTDARCAEHLAALSSWLALPSETLPVGLSTLRLHLLTIMLEWRLESQVSQAAKIQSESSQELEASTEELRLALVERQRAEIEQSRSEHKFRSIVEHTADGIMLADEAGLVVAWNQAAERITGLRASDILGHPIRELHLRLLPAERKTAAFTQRLAVTMEQIRSSAGSVWLDKMLEMDIAHTDGTSRHLQSLFFRIETQQGYLMGMSLRDMTQQKLAEQERQRLEADLHRAQKMEAVGLLAGGMAHHYNNLLMAIQGNAELAMMSSSDSALKYLSVILDVVARAAKLTRQMLAFSRKQMLQTSVLNLNDLVAGLIDKVSQIMGNAVKVEWSPAAQLEPVHADAHALEQIVLELAQNARDAMPDDSGTGTLRISTEMVRLDADSAAVRAGAQPGRYVLLSVSDTGLGMNEQVQEHLFEPFFTTKAVGKGTGLALPMAYGIIRQLDGWIDVTSEPGKGARFEIYLPIRIQFERETNPV